MFNLTRQERVVIVFLLTLAAIGAGLDYLAKRNCAITVAGYLGDDLDKINLNRADKVALQGIVGIGDKLAQRIIEYRNQRGGFEETEELKNIKGIGEIKFNKIKDYLIVE